MSRLGRWLWYVLKRKRFRTTHTRNHQGFHAESLPAQSVLSIRVLPGGSILFACVSLPLRYILLALNYRFPAAPAAGTGRSFIPLIHARPA